jgi:hypothetical protein
MPSGRHRRSGNSQGPGTPNPVHHSRYISRVLYLKTPELAHEDATSPDDRPAILIGGKQRFAKSFIRFRPRVGDFYVFQVGYFKAPNALKDKANVNPSHSVPSSQTAK